MARKVFGREVKRAASPEPQCRACINIGAADHGPKQPCAAQEWGKRQQQERAANRVIPMTGEPCPKCLEPAREGQIRVETVQRLPEGAWAPLARDGSGKCCFDCASAEVLAQRLGMTFLMARIAVGNDRQEQYRLPGVPMGLAKTGEIRMSAPGDHADQIAWLERMGWFGINSAIAP